MSKHGYSMVTNKYGQLKINSYSSIIIKFINR